MVIYLFLDSYCYLESQLLLFFQKNFFRLTVRTVKYEAVTFESGRWNPKVCDKAHMRWWGSIVRLENQTWSLRKSSCVKLEVNESSWTDKLIDSPDTLTGRCPWVMWFDNQRIGFSRFLMKTTPTHWVSLEANK